MAPYNASLIRGGKSRMSKKIIGRTSELQILKEIEKSKDAEFVAVYGRRRVGKTFLIREFFSKKNMYI